MRRRLTALWEGVVSRVRSLADVDGDASTDRSSDTRSAREPSVPADGEPSSSNQQILSILEAESGPVWQNDIVDRTGWSKSTVSRSLCALEDDGVIVRSRIGRRKVVFLAGNEPPVLDRASVVGPADRGPDASPDTEAVDGPGTSPQRPDDSTPRADGGGHVLDG